MAKIGKDVLEKKTTEIRPMTQKEQEDFEEWEHKKLAGDTTSKPQPEERELPGKMLGEDKEPTPEQLARQKVEVYAEMAEWKRKKGEQK